MFYTAESLKDRVTKLHVGDLITIQKWMKRQPIEDATAAVIGLPIEVQNAALKDATQLSARVTMTSPEGYAVMNSPSGVAKFLHLTLLKTEAKLTFEEVVQRLDFTNLEDILTMVLEFNGFIKTKDTVKNEETVAS